MDVTLDQPVKVFFSGQLDGRLLSLTGTMRPLGKQIGQAPIELEISLAALEEFRVKLKGRVEHLLVNPRADLTMEVTKFLLRKLFAALGQPFLLATSDPKVLRRLASAARCKADHTSLAVSDGKLKLDESTLTVMLKTINFSLLS